MAKSKHGGKVRNHNRGKKTENSSNVHPVLAAHRDLIEIQRARKSGDIKRAVKLGIRLCSRHPDYVGALHELGIAQMAARDYNAALNCFVRATMLNPYDWTTLASLAQCYVQLDALEMAARTMKQALAINQDAADIHFTLGAIYERQREYEAAAESFRQALEREPKHAAAAERLGSCLIHLGDLQEAAKAFLRSHEADPLQMAPVAASATLPANVSLIDIEKAMNSARAETALDQDDSRAREAFVQANDLHKKGRHEEAWGQLMLANGLVQKKLGNLVQQRKAARAQFSSLKDSAFKKITPAAQQENVPISLFILGVSRSGKTTVERIIGGIDGVKPGYENPIVELAVKRASQMAGLLSLGSILDLPQELGKEFSRYYLNELNERAGESAIFTNTHPGRIRDVPLLSALVPNVKFLFVKRNREDTAFRILMKQYQEGSNPYAYDVNETFEEVDWYHSLIEFWNEKLPDDSKIVHYEDLVTQPDKIFDQINELCGTDFKVTQNVSMPDDRDCAKPYVKFLTTQ